jgi:hypothetical protein
MPAAVEAWMNGSRKTQTTHLGVRSSNLFGRAKPIKHLRTATV